MKDLMKKRSSERGSASTKALVFFVFLALLANAGIHYVPVAYQAATFRQEMDTAVVKGLAAPAGMKAVDVVKAHLQKAAADNDIPSDAVIDVMPMQSVIQAHAVYQKKINILPFGIYKYTYDFNYTAVPQGYLLKQ